MNEKQRRYYAAYEVKTLGYGGVTRFSQATGMSRETIYQGINQVEAGKILVGEQIRSTGAGRPKATKNQPYAVAAIELAANTKTDKRTMVKWTSHSLTHIATAIKDRGFSLSVMTIWRILKELGYALKANKKDIEGGRDHPDRDAQFQYLNMQGLKMQIQGFPILSIDAKKTEKIGNLKNHGKEWMPKGVTTNVDVYDFGEKDATTKQIRKAIPYGIYDMLKKQGFMNVGIDKNTAEFAVASLLRWWDTIGKNDYPEATEILLFADCGSSNGYRNRLWKYCLQQFADQAGLIVHVCHYPPGTSKWNAIEHEMFSFITINWRARPLTAYNIVLELIRHTTTKTGLQITAVLDEHTYAKGRKITDEQLKDVRLQGDTFHPEWNYTIRPQMQL